MNENIISKDFENQKKYVKKFRVGNVLHGTVKSIQPYGVFIQVSKDVVGILHTNDICFSKIRSPEGEFKIGSKVKVIVKSYDINTGRLSFSTKEIFGTFGENIKYIKENTVVKGVVKNKNKHGVFIELWPNIIGLASHKNSVSYGDEVNVFVKKISEENKRVKLVIVD